MTATTGQLCAFGLLALGACRRTEAPIAAPRAELNLGLAARALIGAESTWLVVAHEAGQGARDVNEDGDADDAFVRVLDVSRGALVGPPLVVGRAGGPPLVAACDGTSAAVAVDEAADGARDWNGDGDALDRVLFVRAPGSEGFENLGFAVASVVVGGTLVACAVDEAAQGAQDLDVDGDADGSVLAVHDLARGATRTFTLRDARPLAIADGRVALALSERSGLDLNGDGDDLDRAVLEVYDAHTGALHNTTLALASPAAVSAGATFGVSVSEAAQGRGDLSGDGEADDAVFHVYDPERFFALDLGLSVPLFPAPVTDARRYLLHALEGPAARDLNGDGDLEDLVLHVFEPETGLVLETGLASQASAVLLGDWVGVSVFEPMQGSRDLDGDGEAGGNVVHVLELASGTLENLGLDAFALHASATRVFLAPSEALAGLDWNGDGDRDDQVLFDWSTRDLATRGSRAGIGAVLDVFGEHALLARREAERGLDASGDGVADDLVLELYDARSGALEPLGWGVGSAARLTSALEVVALVDEEAARRDLNGDGDRADEVLHVLAAPR
jgi:hypothetical protein